MAHTKATIGGSHRPAIDTSPIMGTDPEAGGVPSAPERQADLALAHLRNLVDQAGASLAEVTQVNAFFTDAGYQPALDRAWKEAFPDAPQSPVLHHVVAKLPGPAVRLEFIARLPG